MQRQTKPRIGISSVLPVAPSLAAIVTQIRSAGAEPVVLHQQEPHAEGDLQSAVSQDLAGLDGLIVMGNTDDIDPAKYGQPRHPQTKVESNHARANYEEEAIRQALDAGIPFLGICGGLQRLNTLDHAQNGGSLHQHVPDIVGSEQHMQGDTHNGIPPFVPVQFIQIEAGTRLAAIADGTAGTYAPDHHASSDKMMENSFHHQAVKDVHKEFHVAARSEDGIIEAIEPKTEGRYANQFVLGVQWHPEFGASELGPKIAAQLVEEARTYAKSKTAPEYPGPMTQMIARQRETGDQSPSR